MVQGREFVSEPFSTPIHPAEWGYFDRPVQMQPQTGAGAVGAFFKIATDQGTVTLKHSEVGAYWYVRQPEEPAGPGDTFRADIQDMAGPAPTSLA